MSLTFANKITICRILAVPFFIDAMLTFSEHQPQSKNIALGVFIFAVFTDIVDGYIARTRHQKTRAGAILDPLADKMLLISAYLCLYIVRDQFETISLPTWLVVAVISRDAILLIGAMIIYSIKQNLNIQPTIWGKSATFFQIVSVFGIFFQWAISPILWIVTLVLTLVSGVDYIRKGIKELNAGGTA